MNKLVHLLRRIVNAISTLSLTNQYFFSSIRSPPSSIWSWLLSAYPSDTVDLVAGYEHGARSETRLAPDPTPSLQPTPPLPQNNPESRYTIHRLMNNPALFDPARAPRYPIVLCHGMHPATSVPLLDLVPGLYGFDVRGPAAFPSLRLHYWSSVLSILKHKLGADVIVTGVPG